MLLNHPKSHKHKYTIDLEFGISHLNITRYFTLCPNKNSSNSANNKNVDHKNTQELVT